MTDIASALSIELGRVVLDRTGLNGLFDMEVTFVSTSDFESGAPSIFTAVEEQLGLKLESRRTEVPVIVIDSVERPALN